MSDMTNTERAERARRALIAWAGTDYTVAFLKRSKPLGEDLLAEVVGDLLSDLMHFAHQDTPEQDFDELVEQGRSHFRAELAEERAL